MGISLSGGPWQYNRFDKLDEASKPDYLDFDKDGDKKEPMKKALKEKGKKPCPKCEDKKSPCECKEDNLKEWVGCLIKEGYNLDDYSWSDMKTIFENRMAAYTAGESEKGSRGPAKVTGGKTHTIADLPKMKAPSKEAQQKARKALGLTKEEVCEYLMKESFCNNPVSAEILFNHMSEEWLAAIEEGWKPANQDKVNKQIGKAYDKEQIAKAQSKGDETDKQYKRQIGMRFGTKMGDIGMKK